MSRLLRLGELHQTLVALEGQAKSTAASMADVSSSASQHTLAAQSSLAGVESAASGALAVVRSRGQEIRQTAQEAREGAERDFRGIGQAADVAKASAATALDDILANLRDSPWKSELEELIGLIKIGGTGVEELVTKFGAAGVAGRELRDFLEGFDPGTYADQVRDLTTELRSGAAGLDEVIQQLQGSTSTYAKFLLSAIEAFKGGKITLDEMQRRLDAIRREFPDTELEDLAKALQDQLAQGSL
ncbi:MAG TPA: hypothetical protein VF017_15545 [Thermoanaerobaculia bacterium]|nr:hypothetical protein [Thermoanaerobaculia bacterium]